MLLSRAGSSLAPLPVTAKLCRPQSSAGIHAGSVNSGDDDADDEDDDYGCVCVCVGLMIHSDMSPSKQVSSPFG